MEVLECQRDSNHAAQVVDDLPVVEDTVVHSVLVESCSGWRLNKVKNLNKVEQIWTRWTNLNKVCFSSFFSHLLSLAAWGEGIHHLRPWDLVRARRLQEGAQEDGDDVDDDRNDDKDEVDDHDVKVSTKLPLTIFPAP